MPLDTFIIIFAAAFLCEYVDSSLGMGFGTILAPLFLLMGFAPLQIVPAILLSEFFTGITAGLWHHKFRNIRLDFRHNRQVGKMGYFPKSRDSQIIFVIAICGIIGTIAGVILAVKVSKIIVQTYIGIMVLIIGIMLLFQRKQERRFSWKGIIVIGFISAFNKGVSGGGYGPLVTGGQILSGNDSKSAVGTTSFAEGIICLVAFLSYMVLKGNTLGNYVIPLLIGAITATPFAALTTQKLNTQRLKRIIAIFITGLGMFVLLLKVSP